MASRVSAHSNEARVSHGKALSLKFCRRNNADAIITSRIYFSISFTIRLSCACLSVICTCYRLFHATKFTNFLKQN
jgi:hypothetical protein